MRIVNTGREGNTKPSYILDFVADYQKKKVLGANVIGLGTTEKQYLKLKCLSALDKIPNFLRQF